jgi:hypothetical protein
LIPPDLHWALVWLLGAMTGGLFMIFWTFKQAFFVKKLDPTSKAVMLIALQFVLAAAAIVAIVVGVIASIGASESGAAYGVTSIWIVLIGIVVLAEIVAVVLALAAIFGMRSSIERYYNTVEPIGLRLSGVMTFFFNLLYFQYHFSRIAAWKKTGFLRQ